MVEVVAEDEVVPVDCGFGGEVEGYAVAVGGVERVGKVGAAGRGCAGETYRFVRLMGRYRREGDRIANLESP